MAPGQNSKQRNSNTNTVDVMSPRPILPCFLFTSETGKIDGYSLSRIICETSGNNTLKCVQETKNLWRIYCKTQEARTKLTSHGISYQGKYIKVYSQNPYVTGALNAGLLNDESEQVEMIKVTLKDLYVSVSNEDVMHFLRDILRLTVTSEIQTGYYRDGRGGLTSLENGDRIIWIHPDQLKHPLPRNAFVGTRPVRIFHKNQFESDGACYNCYQTDHQSKNCPNEKACRVCKEPGHDPGSPECTHYAASINVMTIGGYLDPLSNHYKSPFVHKHIPAKTVENHWFYHKGNSNGQTELAQLCLDAKDGGKAKMLSKSILCAKDWDQCSAAYDAMKDIVRSKITQVKAARDKLYLAWQNGSMIVEAVPNPRDLWWGSSLDHEATAHTKPEHWPGKNKLGQILMELSEEFFGKKEVWPEGVPGTVQGLEELNDSNSDGEDTEMEEDEESAEHNVNIVSENSEKIQDNVESQNESQNPSQGSASANSNEISTPMESEKPKDNGNVSDVSKSNDVNMDELVKPNVNKTNYAQKLRQKSNAFKNQRSRSMSPNGAKKHGPSSPRTPSAKRNQSSPTESEKLKVSIVAKDVPEFSSSGKVKFSFGSTNAS